MENLIESPKLIKWMWLIAIGCVFAVFVMGSVRDVENFTQEQEIAPLDTIVSDTAFITEYWIAEISATCYFPSVNQTDSSPYITADNSRINKSHPEKHRWLAVSRDLLKMGFSYGDTVSVSGTWVYDGKWIIHDTMNKRFKKRIDFLVGRYSYLDKFDNIEIWK